MFADGCESQSMSDDPPVARLVLDALASILLIALFIVLAAAIGYATYWIMHWRSFAIKRVRHELGRRPWQVAIISVVVIGAIVTGLADEVVDYVRPAE
jgi:hypothetical protein